jgi:epoxide hydrolase-like predicted phosphatase
MNRVGRDRSGISGSTMSIRAVIFDFGGVLVRTADTAGRRRWEERLGLANGELDRMVFASELSDRSMVGLATQRDIWQYIGARYGLDEETLHQLRRDFWAGDQLDEVLVRFVGELRPQYKTAILSNAWPGAREMFNERFGLGRVADLFVISSEEGVAKPDPRIYHIVLERLGVSPHEAVFVDDFAENVEGAQAVGMTGILFQNTDQVMAEVRRYLDGDVVMQQ